MMGTTNTTRLGTLCFALALGAIGQAHAQPAQEAETPQDSGAKDAEAQASPQEPGSAQASAADAAATAGPASAQPASPTTAQAEMQGGEAPATEASQTTTEARRPPAGLVAAAQRTQARTRRRYFTDDGDVEGPQVRGDAGAAIAVGVSAAFPFSSDRSYDVFSDDDVTTRVGLWASHDLFAPRRDVIIALELGWAIDSEESDIFDGGLSTQFEQHWFHAGLATRYVLLDWLQPELRLQGGVSRIDLELRARNPSETYKDDAFLPFGSLGAGVLLRTPTRLFENRQGRLASLSVGLLIEGGYTLVAPMEVTLDGPGPGRDDISLQEPQLGELQRSGPFVRTALVARF